MSLQIFTDDDYLLTSIINISTKIRLKDRCRSGPGHSRFERSSTSSMESAIKEVLEENTHGINRLSGRRGKSRHERASHARFGRDRGRIGESDDFSDSGNSDDPKYYIQGYHNDTDSTNDKFLFLMFTTAMDLLLNPYLPYWYQIVI